MPRATKIVATLGPASSSPEVLERMIRAGVDVVRLNFSHGEHSQHLEVMTSAREIAARLDRPIALLQDLSGPKIRTGRMKDNVPVNLVPGARLRVTQGRHIGAGAAGIDGDLLYRTPMQPTLDGNTVDSDIEMAQFARNSLDFQASLTFLQSKFRGLSAALKGE